MSSPTDGDMSDGDDGMVAQVIPLRRRGLGVGEIDRVTPVGELPRGPNGQEQGGDPDELSVWEAPTAQLLRRNEPTPRSRTAGGARSTLVRPTTRTAGVVAAVAAIIAVLVVMASASHRHDPTASSAQVAAPHVHISTPSPAHRGNSAHSHHASATRAKSAGSGRAHSQATRAARTGKSLQPAESRPEPSESQLAAAESPTRLAAVTRPAPETQPPTATASRGFGFER